ncbi:MAG: 50S ribosomal protein L3 [bacterium]
MSNPGTIGKKLPMKTVFAATGEPVAATPIALLRGTVIQIRTPEKDYYTAVKVGYEPVPLERLNKPERGPFKKLKLNEGYRRLVEFRVPSVEGFKEGEPFSVEVKEGQVMDVTGLAKGRGFQGVVKRYRFHGQKDSHGTSVTHRRPQSIGCRWPQRVIPGKRMAGHMGNNRVTIKNMQVVKVAGDIVYVKGCVPGPAGGVLQVRPAKGYGVG